MQHGLIGEILKYYQSCVGSLWSLPQLAIYTYQRHVISSSSICLEIKSLQIFPRLIEGGLKAQAVVKI